MTLAGECPRTSTMLIVDRLSALLAYHRENLFQRNLDQYEYSIRPLYASKVILRVRSLLSRDARYTSSLSPWTNGRVRSMKWQAPF